MERELEKSKKDFVSTVLAKFCFQFGKFYNIAKKKKGGGLSTTDLVQRITKKT